MYYDYFGLTEPPFSISPDPKYLYQSDNHREALAHLLFGTEQWGGFIQLTGEVGTGKTMLTRALLRQLPQDVQMALLFNPRQTSLEFVRSICDELGAAYDSESKNSLKELVDALNAHLLENHRQGRRTAIIIDEAQNLEVEVLEQIRLLTNLETDQQKLLMIILVGQPELRLLLARKDLRQLAQRIIARYHLLPLSARDTAEYIRHRLGVAGCHHMLFDAPAVTAVHELTAGVPRLINVLCDRALLAAYVAEASQVSRDMVRQAGAELSGNLPAPQAPQTGTVGTPAWIGYGLAAAMIVTVAALIYIFIPYGPSRVESVPAVAPATAEPEPEAVVATEVMPVAEAAPTAPADDGTLAARLAQPGLISNTSQAFAALFALWSLDYQRYTQATGCDRAAAAGLNCLYERGNWRKLRELNRPAIIELLEPGGKRHHLVLSSLNQSSGSLVLPEGEIRFPLAQIEEFWFGDFLMLWEKPPVQTRIIQPGDRGDAVRWLVRTLNTIDGLVDPPPPSDLYDQDLAARVMAFQRRHRLSADGVVGEQTMIRLNSALARASTPTLTARVGRE